MQDHQLPEIREFKYLGSMLQAERGVKAEISQGIQSGWNNLKEMAGVMLMVMVMLFDERISTRVKGEIHGTLKVRLLL